jgi:hypothetical protein
VVLLLPPLLAVPLLATLADVALVALVALEAELAELVVFFEDEDVTLLDDELEVVVTEVLELELHATLEAVATTVPTARRVRSKFGLAFVIGQCPFGK